MRRLSFSLCLALVTILLVATPALAGRMWCARDPIVSLDGHHLQIWVAIPSEYVDLVDGPIEVHFETPAGMSRSVVLTDEGFNGHGETVTFSDSSKHTVNSAGSFNVRVWVAVPIDETRAEADMMIDKIPTRITIIEDDKAEVLHGWNTGMWVTTRVNNGR